MFSKDDFQLRINFRRADVNQTRSATDFLEKFKSVSGREDRPSNLADHNDVIVLFKGVPQSLADELLADEIRGKRRVRAASCEQLRVEAHPWRKVDIESLSQFDRLPVCPLRRHHEGQDRPAGQRLAPLHMRCLVIGTHHAVGLVILEAQRMRALDVNVTGRRLRQSNSR